MENTNKSNLIKLRIKRKSLSAEAQIIKNAELALKQRTQHLRNRQAPQEVTNALLGIRMELREHRKAVVSFEARASHLANAYLRCQKYDTVEKPARNWRAAFYSRKQLIMRTAEIIAKYASNDSYNRVGKRESTEDVAKKVEAWTKNDQQNQTSGSTTQGEMSTQAA